MKNTFKLSHLVLYAKDWYLKTDNIWEDLIKILELDNYTPFDKMDVYSIILSSVQNFGLYKWTELTEVLNGIHPANCWKYGYYVKDNVFWAGGKTVEELPDYDMPTAFIYYTLSNLRFIYSNDWEHKIPKYSKYPKNRDITIRKVFDYLVKKN